MVPELCSVPRSHVPPGSQEFSGSEVQGTLRVPSAQSWVPTGSHSTATSLPAMLGSRADGWIWGASAAWRCWGLWRTAGDGAQCQF